MSPSTASSIASGVGPLLAALIGAYQLWLKPRVDQVRSVPFDRDRRLELEREVRRLRLQLLLFTALAVAVTAVPVGASIVSLAELDFDAEIQLSKVLVVFVAVVGVIHVGYLASRVRSLGSEIRSIRARRSGSPNEGVG